MITFTPGMTAWSPSFGFDTVKADGKFLRHGGEQYQTDGKVIDSDKYPTLLTAADAEKLGYKYLAMNDDGEYTYWKLKTEDGFFYLRKSDSKVDMCLYYEGVSLLGESYPFWKHPGSHVPDFLVNFLLNKLLSQFEPWPVVLSKGLFK